MTAFSSMSTAKSVVLGVSVRVLLLCLQVLTCVNTVYCEELTKEEDIYIGVKLPKSCLSYQSTPGNYVH